MMHPSSPGYTSTTWNRSSPSHTIRKGQGDHPLNIWDRLRNRRIESKRRPVELVFAVLKRVFDRGRVLVTTVGRVRVKMVFSRLCFHLVQLRSLGVS